MDLGDLTDKVKNTAQNKISDKISDINDDPVGYAMKKGADAAGNTEIGQKVKQSVDDAKKIAKGIKSGARAVESGGMDLQADLELAKLAMDKDFQKRVASKTVKTAALNIGCGCSIIMAPIALIIGLVLMIFTSISASWDDTCPKVDIAKDTMQNFIEYYSAYSEGATGKIAEQYTIVDKKTGKPILDSKGLPKTEAYNMTTPEILAAVDYKENNLSVNIPSCGVNDKACISAAIKCRALVIRIAMQKANFNEMSPSDIDMGTNITYLGNFQKIDKNLSNSKYEPYTDGYIIENYTGDFKALWESVTKVDNFSDFVNKPFITAFTLLGIGWNDLNNALNALFGTSNVGAATFFKLTRPELIPMRDETETPGWANHITEFVSYMEGLASKDDKYKAYSKYEYVPGDLPDGCKVFSNPINSNSAGAGAVTTSDSCTNVLLPKIVDENKYIAAINSYIKSKNPNSPLKGKGREIVEGAKASGINPALVVVIAVKESSLGQNIPTKNSHNAWGRKATSSQPHVIVNGNRWYVWSSWDDAVSGKDNVSAYIKRVYVGTKKSLSITDLLMKYAPPIDHNNTTQYIKDVNQWIGDINNKAGSALECTK